MIKDKDVLNHQIFAEYLIEKYIKRISGDEDEYLIGIDPKDVILVGMLKPLDNDIELLNNFNNYKRYESVPSISLTFLIKDIKDKVIMLQPTGNFYYMIKPSYEEEIKYLLEKYSIKLEKTINTADELLNIVNTSEQVYEDFVIKKYKRIRLDETIEPIKINLERINEVEVNDFIKRKLDDYFYYNCKDSIAIKSPRVLLKDL